MSDQLFEGVRTVDRAILVVVNNLVVAFAQTYEAIVNPFFGPDSLDSKSDISFDLIVLKQTYLVFRCHTTFFSDEV